MTEQQQQKTIKRKGDITSEAIPVFKKTKLDLEKKLESAYFGEQIFQTIEYQQFIHKIKGIVLEGLSSSNDVEIYMETKIRNLWILHRYLKEQKKSQERNKIRFKQNIKKNQVKKNREKVVDGVESVNNNYPTVPEAIHTNGNIETNILENQNDSVVPQTNQQTQNKVTNIGSSGVENRKLTATYPREVKKNENLVEEIWNLSQNHLFPNFQNRKICKNCKQPNELFECQSGCLSWIHKDCSADTNISKNTFSCKDCAQPKCFVCKNKNEGNLIKCAILPCNKYYHMKCMEHWPQYRVIETSGNKEAFNCPCHVCHTCAANDSRESSYIYLQQIELVKCLECPATYHLDSFCIPAGTQILSTHEIICPRHKILNQKKKINVNWCFDCKRGGKLIHCELCPAAFHKECLNLSTNPEIGEYICPQCVSGRLPLYGDLVFGKFGSFRWWPGIIIPPSIVRKSVIEKVHNPNEFCVRFFGAYDCAWLNFSSVYLYEQGDSGRVNGKTKIDDLFNRSREEANNIAKVIKTKKLEQKQKKTYNVLQPLPYEQIKFNVIFSSYKHNEDIEATECNCESSTINPCGPGSDCINRNVYIECDPKHCRAGSECQNQRFRNAIYPSLEVNRINAKGWGLMTKEILIPEQFIIEYVGEIITDDEFKARMHRKYERKDNYFYFCDLQKGYKIDAERKGNLSRFINHSCEPNCRMEKWNVNGKTRLGLFALKDISANTELTISYKYSTEYRREKCLCGADKCSGFVGA